MHCLIITRYYSGKICYVILTMIVIVTMQGMRSVVTRSAAAVLLGAAAPAAGSFQVQAVTDPSPRKPSRLPRKLSS